MSNERLTRQEIGWLLAQEARGAARALREGVTLLTHPPPSSEAEPGGESQPGKSAPSSRGILEAQPQVETTLDTLDDVIGMLSALQDHSVAARRGRIDLAALLCEIAPNARIEMRPGEGMEVFGEEHELRRMLHVLVNQTNSTPSGALSAAQEVAIRREGDFVRISVELGPDSSASNEIERRWLNRMAMRHGGRLEFKGGQQTLFLPADGASDQREVAELRKELEQAQQLGEAYARELATVFAVAESSPPTDPPADTHLSPSEGRFATLVSLSAAMSRNLRDWTEALRTDVTQARAENGEHSSLTERLSRRLTAMLEVSGELGAVAECPTNEAVTPSADLGAIVTRAIEAVASRANRRGVQLKADVASELTFAVREQTLGVLLRSLLTQGIEATPRGENVMVRLLARNDRLSISVEDGGPSVPIQARKDVLAHRVDPGAYGRPAGVSLVVADATAAYLGGSLLFRESTAGRTELAVELGSPSPTGGG